MEFIEDNQLDEHEKQFNFCGECGSLGRDLVRIGGQSIDDGDEHLISSDFAWLCEDCLKEAFELFEIVKVKRIPEIKHKKFIKAQLRLTTRYVRQRFDKDRVKDFENLVEFFMPFLDEME